MKATYLFRAYTCIVLSCIVHQVGFTQQTNSATIDSAKILNRLMNKSAFGLLISRSGIPTVNDGAVSWSGGMGNDWLQFEGMKLASCVGYLLELDAGTRIVAEDSLMREMRVDLLYHGRVIPDSILTGKYMPGSATRNYLLQSLGNAFDFIIRFTDEPVFHYQLVCIDTTKGRSFPVLTRDTNRVNIPGYGPAPLGGISGENADLSSLARALESVIHVPVTVTAAAATRFTYDLNFKSLADLNEQLWWHGLQLQENSTEPVRKAYLYFHKAKLRTDLGQVTHHANPPLNPRPSGDLKSPPGRACPDSSGGQAKRRVVKA